MQKNHASVAGPDFMQAFAAKGRMAGVLQRLPLHIITEPRVGLLGAARHAALGGGNRD
jgi:glucokinase